jgi:hypothetical protein
MLFHYPTQRNSSAVRSTTKGQRGRGTAQQLHHVGFMPSEGEARHAELFSMPSRASPLTIALSIAARSRCLQTVHGRGMFQDSPLNHKIAEGHGAATRGPAGCNPSHLGDEGKDVRVWSPVSGRTPSRDRRNTPEHQCLAAGEFLRQLSHHDQTPV